MNHMELAIFLEELDVEETDIYESFEGGRRQDLLHLTLEKPLRIGIYTKDGFGSLICDSIELLSRDRIIYFLLDGYEIRTLDTLDILRTTISYLTNEEIEEAYAN